MRIYGTYGYICMRCHCMRAGHSATTKPGRAKARVTVSLLSDAQRPSRDI